MFMGKFCLNDSEIPNSQALNGNGISTFTYIYQ